MATVQARKVITLTGKLITPLVSPSPSYKKNGCRISIVGNLESNSKARFSTIGKLVKGERRAPIILKGFRGFVKVSCVASSELRARSKIARFLSERFLGRYSSEGFGKVQWLACQIEDYQPSSLPANPDTLPLTKMYCPSCEAVRKTHYWVIYLESKVPARFYRCTTCKHIWRGKQLKIRKGLGTNYPEELQRLILALLLHDFVHTPKHLSKIYEQVTIEDEEIREACLHHHDAEEGNGNNLLPILKYYDGLASYLSRKKPFKVISRYDHQNGKMDFKQLAKAIEERQHSAHKLYQFIYQSAALSRVVEAMDYGKIGTNNLKNHLLLLVNLAINDYYAKRLVIKNGNLQIVETEKVSSSATEGEAVACSAMDAEMHPFPTMNNADSESPSNSMKEEAWNIGGEKPTKEKVGGR